MQATCACLDIPYFEGKERYWEKVHHSLGGNLSSRIHLNSKESDRFQDVQQRAKGQRSDHVADDRNYRQVYYERPDETTLEAHIARLRQDSPYLDSIEEMLAAHDVTNAVLPDDEWPELKLGMIDMYMKQLRQSARMRIGKLRFV